MADTGKILKVPDPSSMKKRAGEYLLAVGTEAVDTVTALASLIIIGRAYGREGLGVYSFFLAVYLIVSYLSESGVCKQVERRVAMKAAGGVHPAYFSGSLKAITLTGFLGAVAVILLGLRHPSGAGFSGALGPYIFLAVAVYLNVYNTFVTAVLNGKGDHESASRLALRKRLVFLGSVFLLSVLKFKPPLLVLGFFAAEMSVARRGRRQVKLPLVKNPFSSLSEAVSVIREGAKDYFTDEALRVIFFLDFLVLGFFVSAGELGIYSEASVLARLFLIVPVGAAPVFRVRFFELSAAGSETSLASRSGRTARRIFFWHSVAGLYFLLYYPLVLGLIFPEASHVQVSFEIFAVLLPGLLYYSAASVLEPIYAAQGRSDRIGRIAMRTFFLNALLNAYLVPYAGINGAAAATAICLIAYFFYFGAGLESNLRLPRVTFLLAGGLVFLSYKFVVWAEPSPLMVVPALPLALWVLFYLSGFFTDSV